LTLTKLDTLLVPVLPVAAKPLFVVHFALVRRKNLKTHAAGVMTEPKSTARRYWPYQSSRNLAAFFALLLVAVGLAWQWTVWETRGMETAGWELPPNSHRQTAPVDPDLLHLARPEWYVRPLYELCILFLPSERC
jgi:hypothetical protein